MDIQAPISERLKCYDSRLQSVGPSEEEIAQLQKQLRTAQEVSTTEDWPKLTYDLWDELTKPLT